MKILMVNKFLYPNGGSETYIFKLGEALEKKGHEVQYFGMEHEGRIVGNHAEQYTANMDFHGGKLRKLLYPFKIIYSPEAKRKMTKVLKDFNPDAVHLNNINFQITPSVIYAVRDYEKKIGRHIPIVFTAHDYQWVCPNHMMRVPDSGRICFDCIGGNYGQCNRNRCIHNSRMKSMLGTIEAKFYAKKGTYGLVDIIICPSQFMKDRLDTDPVLQEKTVMMHNFIDRDEALDLEKNPMSAENAKADNREENKKDYVLYFGRFTQEKGTETLLEACKELKDIPFVFAGTGPLDVDAYKLPNVENRGFVTGNALKELIAGARFSVYPSEWYENCPFSVMESQMYGTPVLASDLGGSGELIQVGKTGDMFRGGDVEELTEHIRALWDDRELCEEYSKNCRNLSFDTTDEYCDKMLKMYAGK